MTQKEKQAKHTPGPWSIVKIDAETCDLMDDGHVYQAHGQNGIVRVADLRPDYPGHDYMADVRLCAAAPDLLAACEGLLADVTGPAMVYGDGCGNDGKKTGLTHQEFNELRKRRVDTARAAIAKATKP